MISTSSAGNAEAFTKESHILSLATRKGFLINCFHTLLPYAISNVGHSLLHSAIMQLTSIKLCKKTGHTEDWKCWSLSVLQKNICIQNEHHGFLRLLLLHHARICSVHDHYLIQGKDASAIFKIFSMFPLFSFAFECKKKGYIEKRALATHLQSFMIITGDFTPVVCRKECLRNMDIAGSRLAFKLLSHSIILVHRYLTLLLENKIHKNPFFICNQH